MKKPAHEPTRVEQALIELLVMLANRPEAHRLVTSTRQGAQAMVAVEHWLLSIDDAKLKAMRTPKPLTTDEADMVAKAAIEEMMEAVEEVHYLKEELRKTQAELYTAKHNLRTIHNLSR